MYLSTNKFSDFFFLFLHLYHEKLTFTILPYVPRIITLVKNKNCFCAAANNDSTETKSKYLHLPLLLIPSSGICDCDVCVSCARRTVLLNLFANVFACCSIIQIQLQMFIDLIMCCESAIECIHVFNSYQFVIRLSGSRHIIWLCFALHFSWIEAIFFFSHLNHQID